MRIFREMCASATETLEGGDLLDLLLGCIGAALVAALLPIIVVGYGALLALRAMSRP